MTRPTERTAPVRVVSDKPRLRPTEAVDYLLQTYGLIFAEGTLMKWRSKGGGPAFRKVGHHAYYDVVDLDVWAKEKLGHTRRRTGDDGSMVQ